MHTTVILTVCVLSCIVGQGSEHGNKFHVPWQNLYKLFLDISDAGLQAHTIQDDIRSNFVWTTEPVDATTFRKQKLKTLTEVLETTLESVTLLHRALLNNFDAFDFQAKTPIPAGKKCCETVKPYSGGCLMTAQEDGTAISANTPHKVLETVVDNMERYHLVLNQYFAFTDGSVYIWPARPKEDYETCGSYDPRRRYWYVESEASYPRDIVLLLDQTAITTPLLLKQTVNRVLDCITSGDKVIVVPSAYIADNGYVQGDWWAREMRAGLGVWMDGHEKLKKDLRRLVEKEVANPGGNRFISHINALHWGQHLLHQKPLDLIPIKRDPVDVVVLVTDRPGWESWRNNAELSDTVFNILEKNTTLVILTLAGSDAKSQEFMMGSSLTWLHIVPILREDQLTRANLAIYTRLTEQHKHASDEAIITMPYWDAFGASLIMSICLPININDTFYGAACNDVSIVNLFERFMTIPDVKDAYVFLMDRYGRAMMHPLLQAPYKLTDDPVFIHMTRLEQSHEAHPILDDMLQGGSGSKVIFGKLVFNTGRPFQMNMPNAINIVSTHLRYSWGSALGGISLAVVLPLYEENGLKAYKVNYRCKSEDICKAEHFLYHRLDLDNMHMSTTCRFFAMVAVHGNALVKLAPSCFHDVLEYIQHETNATVRRLYDIFRRGRTTAGFLTGTELREDVALGERAEDYWRDTGNLSQLIGARYMGTAEGVFVVYPGTRLKSAYDPRDRPWYRRALEITGEIKGETPMVAVSPPYCDAFGSGLIITLSTALTAPTPMEREVVAVVAGDFTSNYLNNYFVQQLPGCEENCFLMDKYGYVVTHSKWQTQQQRQQEQDRTQCKVPAHGAHVNAAEPAIGRKLVELNILKRKSCLDYGDAELFLYWYVVLPPNTNQFITEDFAINHVPFTNLFLVVYDPLVTAAQGCRCPEMLIPGLPLRCHNTCEDYCECPCVAGPSTNPCRTRHHDLFSNNQVACWPRLPRLTLPPPATPPPAAMSQPRSPLPPCINYVCTAKTLGSCSSQSMGCVWLNNTCHSVNELYL